nr:hypothetical protein [Pseudomonas syringae]
MNNVVQGDFPRHRRDDEIDIPQYDVVASMGPGQVRPKEYIETVRNITVRTEYLREQGITYTTGDNLSVITGFGESMGATFSSGDPLIVDQGVNEVVVMVCMSSLSMGCYTSNACSAYPRCSA